MKHLLVCHGYDLIPTCLASSIRLTMYEYGCLIGVHRMEGRDGMEFCWYETSLLVGSLIDEGCHIY